MCDSSKLNESAAAGAATANNAEANDAAASVSMDAPAAGSTAAASAIALASAAAAPGVFITFEGGEGAGKSTHIAFLARCLRDLGYEVLCLREPGGTAIGEALRNIVLDPENACMDSRCELFIYEAARAQIVSQVIAPALKRGAVVLCDRFYDSTMAYQAYGRGLSAGFIGEASCFACQGIAPARTVLMVSASAEEGLSRATQQGADRIEQAGVDFHSRVNAGFQEIAAREPDRVRVVSFAASKAQTAQRVFNQVKDLFPQLEDAICSDEHYFERIEEGGIGESTCAEEDTCAEAEACAGESAHDQTCTKEGAR